MKKNEKNPTLTQSAGSQALITIPRPAPRRGILAATVHLLAAIVILPVRLPILALMAAGRGLARAGSAAGRGLGALLLLPVKLVTLLARLVALPFVGLAKGVAWVAPRLGRGLVALLKLPVKIVILLARLVALPFVGLAKGVAWVAPRLGRGLVALLKLPVRIVILLARLVALLVRGIALAILFILRIPFTVLRLAGRGSIAAARGAGLLAGAIAVPVFALAWGAVRALASGVAAVARGTGIALAFLGRLAGRGIAALFLGIFVTFRAIAVGTFVTLRALAIGLFVCARGTARIALWAVVLPFLAARFIGVAAVRGIRRVSILLVDAVRTIAAGVALLVRGTIAIVAVSVRGVGRGIKAASSKLATREPQHACYVPLAALAALAAMELVGSEGFPFATFAVLLLAAFAALALLQRPTTTLAVILAWGLAVAAVWRAESISPETVAFVDILSYLSALAALWSAYVAARAFVRDVPVAWRNAEQERAHRRAGRAIGLVLAVQCIVLTVWAASAGRASETVIFGELLLVGAGMALAWIVRSGHAMITAQVTLWAAAIVTLVGVIAAQLAAFAQGRLYSAASLAAFVLLLLVSTALTVVVHTRLVDSE